MDFWKSQKECPFVKNLRVCGVCLAAMKLIAKITSWEVILRDANRFHHFKNGFCSCRDYWCGEWPGRFLALYHLILLFGNIFRIRVPIEHDFIIYYEQICTWWACSPEEFTVFPR